MSQKDSEKDLPNAASSADQGSSSSVAPSKEKPRASEKKDDKKPDEEELSEEDQQLKSELEMLVERLKVFIFILLAAIFNHICSSLLSVFAIVVSY